MRRAGFIAFLVIVVALTAAIGVLAWRQVGGAGPLAIGGPFHLIDGDGKPVSDTDFRGQWMMIYFGYTHCPDACPTALSDMGLALDQLGERRARVRPIFITIDPERDTPALLKDYVKAFGPDIIGLTGTPDQLAPVEKEFRVYALKHPTKDGDYDMDHSSIIYVMDPQGRFVTNFTHETDPAQMAKRLSALMS